MTRACCSATARAAAAARRSSSVARSEISMRRTSCIASAARPRPASAVTCGARWPRSRRGRDPPRAASWAGAMRRPSPMRPATRARRIVGVGAALAGGARDDGERPPRGRALVAGGDEEDEEEQREARAGDAGEVVPEGRAAAHGNGKSAPSGSLSNAAVQGAPARADLTPPDPPLPHDATERGVPRDAVTGHGHSPARTLADRLSDAPFHGGTCALRNLRAMQSPTGVPAEALVLHLGVTHVARRREHHLIRASPLGPPGRTAARSRTLPPSPPPGRARRHASEAVAGALSRPGRRRPAQQYVARSSSRSSGSPHSDRARRPRQRVGPSRPRTVAT